VTGRSRPAQCRSDRHLDLRHVGHRTLLEEHAGGIRAALERYSTWSFSEALDIAESVGLVDFGDVDSPDAEVAPSAWRRPCRDGTRASRYG